MATNHGEVEILKVFLSEFQSNIINTLQKDSIILYYKYAPYDDSQSLLKQGSFYANNDTMEIDKGLIKEFPFFAIYKTLLSYKDVDISKIYFDFGKRGINIDYAAITYPLLDKDKKKGIIQVMGNGLNVYLIYKYDLMNKKWVYDKSVDLYNLTDQ